MTSKEALEKIIFDYNFKEKIESGYISQDELAFIEGLMNIKRDLEILKIIENKINVELGWQYNYTDLTKEEINLLKEWLDNDSHRREKI